MAFLIAKTGTIFVSRRPLITMAGTAHYYGRDRSLLRPGPHRSTHYYGRDRTGTPGPHRDRTGSAPRLLWPGPHRDTHYYGRARTGTKPGPHYYGRVRTGTLITMAGPAPGSNRALITMAGSAPRHSLLRPGPHRPRITLGRARQTVWTLQSNFQKV